MGKKDKKKPKAKEDPNKLTQVDRTFYEITITDLNQKLARLRSHLVTLDENNVTLKEQLKAVTEERTDVVAHLEKTLAGRIDYIAELEERLVETIKVRNRENAVSAEKIKDQEVKYKAMHDQLTSEIKLLNGKLNSLDEFRIQRDVLMAKFDDQEADAKEKERLHQELIYNMEQQAVVEKDALKKEVEAKLLQVSADFTRCTEIRNAGYTRRLLRENIALQKEIDCLVLSQFKMQRDFEEYGLRNKEIAQKYTILDQLKVELIRSSQNKIRIIEKLTENYERLKAKHVEVLKYRSLYENLAKQDVCERFTANDMSKKLKILGQRIEVLKLEKNRLISEQDQHLQEILRLRGVLQQIKTTVQIAIKVIEEEKHLGMLPDSAHSTAEDEVLEEAAALRKLQRKDLLHELLDIVSSHTDDFPETPSLATSVQSKSPVYKPGKMGFLPRSASCLMEIFKRDAHRLVSAEVLATAYQVKKEESKIIPKSRAAEAGSIIDVQMGSSLYVSDSHEDMDLPADPAEDPEDMGEEVSSSEFAEEDREQRKSAPQRTPSGKPGDKATTPVQSLEKETAAITSDTASRGSRVSRMSRQQSLPQIDDEAYSINLFY